MSDGDDMVRDVLSRAPGHPLRVAIDGVTASGKTTCAQWLVNAVAAQGRPSVHVTMDGFHHRRAHRYRQGRASPLGYYRDAYDFDAFVSHVLIPLGPNGSGAIRRRVIDLATDEPVDDPLEPVPADAIVVVDGTFLHRPPLPDYWDYTVFVDTPMDVARARGTPGMRRRSVARRRQVGPSTSAITRHAGSIWTRWIRALGQRECCRSTGDDHHRSCIRMRATMRSSAIQRTRPHHCRSVFQK
jgi:uridine kinase